MSTNQSTTKKDEKAAKVEQKTILELLEEDDEFEEFEGVSWEDVTNQNEDTQLWQDDWDDDDTNDNFTQQLREQIELSVSSSGGTSNNNNNGN